MGTKKYKERVAGFDWATHIKIYRKKRNWSQTGFAKHIGTHQTMISRWEQPGYRPERSAIINKLLKIEEFRFPFAMYLLHRYMRIIK